MVCKLSDAAVGRDFQDTVRYSCLSVCLPESRLTARSPSRRPGLGKHAGGIPNAKFLTRSLLHLLVLPPSEQSEAGVISLDAGWTRGRLQLTSKLFLLQQQRQFKKPHNNHDSM